MTKRFAYALLMGLAAPSLALAQTATTTEPAASTAAPESPAAETAPAPATVAETPATAADAATTPAPAGDVGLEALALDKMEEVSIGKTRYVTEQSTTSLFSSDLVGSTVYGVDDEKIGDINDLMIAGDGAVEAVVIGVGGFLGLGEKDVAIPLDALDVSLVDDSYRITVPATERDLMDAPSFARADGTTSDRLGAFERNYEKARAEAEAYYNTARERASELYDSASKEAGALSERAQDEANKLIERGRQAVNELSDDAATTVDGEPDAKVIIKKADGTTTEPAPAQ